MKTRPCILLAGLSLLVVLAPGPSGRAAQTNAPALPKMLDGVYVTGADVIPAITLRFTTNGIYRAEVGDCGPAGCQTEEGTWAWDDAGQQFLLSCTQRCWHFDFRRFLVTPQEPDTLQWVSRQGDRNVLGVYKRIQFKRRQKEP